MKTKRIKAVKVRAYVAFPGAETEDAYLVRVADVTALIEQLSRDTTEYWWKSHYESTTRENLTYALKRAGIRAGRKGKK